MAKTTYKYDTTEFRAFNRRAIHTAMYENGVEVGTAFWLHLNRRYALQVRWGWYNEPAITHFTLYREKRRQGICHHLPIHFLYGGEVYNLPRWKKPLFRKLGYNLGYRFYKAMHSRFIHHNLKTIARQATVNTSVKLS